MKSLATAALHHIPPHTPCIQSVIYLLYFVVIVFFYSLFVCLFVYLQWKLIIFDLMWAKLSHIDRSILSQ